MSKLRKPTRMGELRARALTKRASRAECDKVPLGREPERNIMKRVINFAAGPAAMPLPVLQEIEKDLVNYKGTGLSVMEMSHRSKMYEAIINEAREDLKNILNLNDGYDILFLQGGASLQFAMVPLNLANEGDLAYYAVTGNFANKAWEEAKKWLNAIDLTNSMEDRFNYIPEIPINEFSNNINKE